MLEKNQFTAKFYIPDYYSASLARLSFLSYFPATAEATFSMCITFALTHTQETEKLYFMQLYLLN